MRARGPKLGSTTVLQGYFHFIATLNYLGNLMFTVSFAEVTKVGIKVHHWAVYLFDPGLATGGEWFEAGACTQFRARGKDCKFDRSQQQGTYLPPVSSTALRSPSRIQVLQILYMGNTTFFVA